MMKTAVDDESPAPNRQQNHQNQNQLDGNGNGPVIVGTPLKSAKSTPLILRKRLFGKRGKPLGKNYYQRIIFKKQQQSPTTTKKIIHPIDSKKQREIDIGGGGGVGESKEQRQEAATTAAPTTTVTTAKTAISPTTIETKKKMSSMTGMSVNNHHAAAGMATGTTTANHTERPLLLSQCKKVFVQRDYAQGLMVRFPVKMPQELQNRIDDHTFEKTVTELNRVYEEAERTGSASCGETLLGCLSCYLVQFCMKTQYDKCLHKIAKFLKEQNETIYIPHGLFITDPIERGLRVLEVTILQPDENA